MKEKYCQGHAGLETERSAPVADHPHQNFAGIGVAGWRSKVHVSKNKLSIWIPSGKAADSRQSGALPG